MCAVISFIFCYLQGLACFFFGTTEAARQDPAIDAPSSGDRAEFLDDLDDLRVCGSLMIDGRWGKHLGQSTAYARIKRGSTLGRRVSAAVEARR